MSCAHCGMKFANELQQRDRELAAANLKDFVPAEVYDIHAHPYNAGHYPPATWKFLEGQSTLGCAGHRSALSRYVPAQSIHGLYFGLPNALADRRAGNAWIVEDLKMDGTALSRALLLVSPEDDPVLVANALRSRRFCGLKVYHCYAGRTDTMNAGLVEFAPVWMWELLHEFEGVLMLH